MISSETKIRVYYQDTDKMGVSYYGNYARYYEIGRTELIRELGFTYKIIEEQGILLPARSLHVNYLKSAHYDDLLTIKTIVETIPKVKFPIKTEIYNQHGELINYGETVLVFYDAKLNKPIQVPEIFLERIMPYFD